MNILVNPDIYISKHDLIGYEDLDAFASDIARLVDGFVVKRDESHRCIVYPHNEHVYSVRVSERDITDYNASKVILCKATMIEW